MLLCIAPVAKSAEPLFSASPFGPHVEATAGHRGRFGDTSRGNRVAIVNNGYEALLLRVHLIRNARRSIDVQTFIWTNDECGRLLICELIEAARRGVRVRILADHFVSDKDPETVAWLSTVHTNLEVKHYRPAAQRIKPSKFRAAMEGLFRMRDTNQRMHNKLMVFDDAIVLTGGRNIENTYFDHSTEMNFKDRDVIAVGPIAADATKSFEEFWDYRHSVAGRDLVDVAAEIRRGVKMRRDKREDYDFGGYFRSWSGRRTIPRRSRSGLRRSSNPPAAWSSSRTSPARTGRFRSAGRGRSRAG